MTAKYNEAAISDAVKLLSSHPDFKIIRKITPRITFADSDGRTLSKGCCRALKIDHFLRVVRAEN